MGNHNTALFWEYDTRLAWRWNRDPVIIPSQSPYVVFDGNPIVKTDPNGNCTDCPNKFSNGNGSYAQPDKSAPAELEDVTVSAARGAAPTSGEANATGGLFGGSGSMNLLQAAARGVGRDPDGSKRAASFEKAYQEGYLPYQPDVVGISIPYNAVGLSGVGGSVSFGIFPKSGEAGIWTTNGLAIGTPDVSVGFGFFAGEYKGKGIPTMGSYMGYGNSGDVSFLGFNLGYSQGFTDYNGDVIWNTGTIGFGFGAKSLPAISIQHQPFNYTTPLLKTTPLIKTTKAQP